MRAGWIFATIAGVAASAALVVIAFSVYQQGLSVYCVGGCFSGESIVLFAVPFGFLFVRNLAGLLVLWLIVATVRGFMRKRRTRLS
jgi:hypothetical protein